MALDLKPTQVIEFDCETFGLASNNGQMIEEFAAKAKAGPAVPRAGDDAGASQGAEGREEGLAAVASSRPLLEKLKLQALRS